MAHCSVNQVAILFSWPSGPGAALLVRDGVLAVVDAQPGERGQRGPGLQRGHPGDVAGQRHGQQLAVQLGVGLEVRRRRRHRRHLAAGAGGRVAAARERFQPALDLPDAVHVAVEAHLVAGADGGLSARTPPSRDRGCSSCAPAAGRSPRSPWGWGWPASPAPGTPVENRRSNTLAGSSSGKILAGAAVEQRVDEVALQEDAGLDGLQAGAGRDAVGHRLVDGASPGPGRRCCCSRSGARSARWRGRCRRRSCCPGRRG